VASFMFRASFSFTALGGPAAEALAERANLLAQLAIYGENLQQKWTTNDGLRKTVILWIRSEG
jgi:hypothetical protein